MSSVPSSSQTGPGLDAPLVTKGFNDLSLDEVEKKIREAKECFDTAKANLGTSMPNDCMIWIATDVTNETFKKVLNFGRFLFKDGNLYVRKVPDNCHSAVHGDICLDIGSWRNRNNLGAEIGGSIAKIGSYSEEKCEPDVEIGIVSEGNVPRVVFEIEVLHRTTPASLDQASRYFQEPNVVAVVLMKVWPRDVHQTFAAAAVVWERDDGGDIRCVQCHDFGSRLIHTRARDNFAAQVPPNVPRDMQFQTPSIREVSDQREPQNLTIPAGILTTNANNSQGIPLANLSINDLEFNLTEYAKLIERTLDANSRQEEVEDD